MTLLLLYVGIALSVSFLCSVLEASLLSVGEVELHDRAQRGEKAAKSLLAIKDERMDDAISAILTLNTIAHTIGATLAGAQAAIVFGSKWVGVFSAVLTLLVLVVTEIIPKTLGTVYASSLVGFVARTLRVLMIGLHPVLLVTGALTRLISHGDKRPISRGELGSLVSLATQEGTLEHGEARVLSNVLQMQKIPVEDVMTPRTVVVMVPADMTMDEFRRSANASVFSRVPVWEESQDNVVGYVRQVDVLRRLAGDDGGGETSLRDVMLPIGTVTEDSTVRGVLREFLEHREHIGIVTDEFGTVRGLVTLEDLLETVLGTEILDESDQVADLRQLAVQLRNKRLKRLKAERRLVVDIPDDEQESDTLATPD